MMGRPTHSRRTANNEMICPIRYVENVGKRLRTVADIVVSLRPFSSRKQEYFICLSLDSDRRLLAQRVVTVGLLDATLVHPREVFAGAIADRAYSVIVAHNHPLGVAKPSADDIKTTQQLLAASKLLGVPIKDHIIVARWSYFSFKEHNMLLESIANLSK